MQGHLDETEFIRNRHSEDELSLIETSEAKEPFLKQVKAKVFSVFYRMNTLKMKVGMPYHVIMLLVETFQLLSLVLVDGVYSALGPYEKDSPWNLSQTQWLIDVCWVFRFDRYFRTSLVGYVIVLCVWGVLVGFTVTLGVALAFMPKATAFNNFLIKTAKIMVTLLCDIAFIPVVDSLAFGMKCSLTTSDECMSLKQGYEYLVLFIACLSLFLSLVGLCSLLYYDFCLVCGGLKAKPHPRIKLLRLVGYIVVVFAFYFTTSSARIVLFLIISLTVGVLLSYIHTQYMPYFNSQICKMRLGSIVSFTSAAFCMLIGEFFKSTDQTNSSVTMLFYFLTPCLIQITQLALVKRGKSLRDRKIQGISNIYQVEIKSRMHVTDIEEARSRSTKSVYNEDEDDPEENFTNIHNRSLREIESLYQEAFKKFPNSEYLYVWSGLLQLHMFESYVLAMVQCYKGMLIANKLDSQYAFYHFSRTSASCYKQFMKDDAYDYVLFEKCFALAQKNDETVTRSQFFFWSELESKIPKLQKLIHLAGEASRMIGITKNNYHLLMKLNPKSTQAMVMYGDFLKSLNNFNEVGDKYKAKARSQQEAQCKSMNTNVLNTLNQPLSFFDGENVVISVSGDFETLGEVLKVSTLAFDVTGYLQAELMGRNISLVIPSPFAESHDDYMRKFHDIGAYSLIDRSGLCLYFVKKNGYVFEARTLIKVVPSEETPPFLMAVILPTKPSYEVLILNHDFFITATSDACEQLFDLGISKNTEICIDTVVTNFEDVKEHMDREEFVTAKLTRDVPNATVKCQLGKLTLGSHFAYILKVTTEKSKAEDVDGVEKSPGMDADRPVSEQGRSVSILKAAVQTKDVRINFKSDSSSDSQKDGESSESEEESASEDESSNSSESLSKTSQSRDKSSSSVSQNGLKVATAKPLFSPDTPDEDKGKISADHSESSEDKSGIHHEGSRSLVGEEPSKSFSITDSKSFEDEIEIEPDSSENEMASVISSQLQTQKIMKLSVFNNAIKSLISFEFSRTKKYVWRFKATLVLTIVLLIATSIATFSVIKSSATYNETLSHFVNLVGDLRLYSISLAYYVRVITLMDIGFLPSDTRNQYFQWLFEDSSDLHDINLRLYRNYDFLSESDRKVYIEELIPTWLLEGGHLRLVKTNLFDATSSLFLQAHLIEEQLRTPPLKLTGKRTYYVYRNGEGELIEYLNKSARFYVNSALNDVVKERLTAILLIMVSVLVLLFCALFAIIPSIRILEKSKKDCWDIFLQAPPYVCRVMKGRCSDRLTDLNDTANVEIEEVKQEGSLDEEKDELSPSSKRDAPKPPGKDSEKEILRKRSRSDEIRKRLSYDPRQRKIVLLKLCCFFLISVVYFYLIYYTGFETIGGVLEEEPVTIDWASRRRQLSRSINFWVLEALIENVTGIGFKDVVPAGQNLGSPFRAADRHTNELEYVENSLIFGNALEGLSFNEMRGTKHDALMFADACAAPVNRTLSDCDEVGNRAMKQGLHSALGMYVTLSRTILQTIGSAAADSSWTWAAARAMYLSDDMQLLRDMDEHYLYDPLSYSSNLYETDYKASEEVMTMWQNLLISLYSVFALVFFVLVYNPMILKVSGSQIGKETKNSWSMCTLMPYEYREEFKLLTAAIRDRKDSFKWR